MILLPIVGRELRVAARRKATIWTRFFAGLTALLAGAVLLMANQGHLAVPYMGRQIFTAVSILAFGFALLSGIFLTADCLCSERRDGTLGLLFLTDLRGYDVVLGKLVATSTVAAYALLAIVPVLGIPLLMGGTDAGEFLRVVLVLGLTLVLSLATGMLASALSRDTRSAMIASLGMMLGLTAGLFLLTSCARWVLNRNVPSLELISRASPITAFMYAQAGSFGMPKFPARFWSSMAYIGTLAFGQLALASFLLPRSWQEGVISKAPLRSATTGQARELIQGLKDSDSLRPFYWLTSREPFPGKAALSGLSLLAVVWVGFFFMSMNSGNRSRSSESLAFCMFIAFGMHAIAKGLMAMQATKRFCEDRRSGALELVLVSPLTVESILDGHWRALRKQFRPLLWLLVIMNLLLVFAVFRLGMPSEVVGTFATMYIGGIILLYSDCQAICWVGMRLGLRGVRHHRAILGTLGRIVLAPWLVIFLFIFVAIGSRSGVDGVVGFFVIWTILSVFLAQLQATRAKDLLGNRLREIASGEPEVGVPPLLQNFPTPALSNLRE
ncbi:MAG: hypothetical protein QOF48_2285 [Verrucomicrobiota bacterium]|jgi:ABC-type transport system involved in multi-copper enzyme maturation permease subunit